MNNLTTTLRGDSDYPINFSKDQSYANKDRHLDSISLKSSFGDTTIIVNNTKMYNEILDQSFICKAGDNVTAMFSFTGAWMNGYVYIDRENDGQFDSKIEGKTIDSKSDIMTFSALHDHSTGIYYDCQGKTLPNGNNLQPPSFTIPSELTDGFYRLRYKVDWCCIDPAGNTIQNNDIVKNRGAIVDTRLCIRNGNDKSVKITAKTSSNGKLFLVQGSSTIPLDGSTTTIGKALTIKIQPNDGFKIKSIKLKHGNLSENPKNSLLRSPQFTESTFLINETSDVFEIKPSYIDGDLEFTAEFESSGYTLIFNDEFDQPDNSQPDPNKWRRCNRANPTWKRFVSDSKDVVYIKDKKLVLRCIPNPNKDTDKVDMLSGAIESSTKFDFMYGKVECRMKTNPHKGNFPACWMMPAHPKVGWPSCGEIDIFEQINTENRAYHTVHSHWTYDLKKKTNPKSSSYENADMSQYHVYGLEWDPTKISWFLDGKEVFNYQKLSGNTDALNNGQWPFDQNFFLILNQSVGRGDWAANPDINHIYETNVDYIRVWQKKQS